MKVEIDNKNQAVERVLTAVYGSADDVPKQYQNLEGVAYNFVGYVPPRIIFLVPGSEEVKKGSPVIVEREGEKVCKQVKAVKVQELKFEKQVDGLATNYVFYDTDGERLGYTRRYAGITTFCDSILASMAEAMGHKDAFGMVKGLKDGDYKLVYIVDHVFPGQE